MFKYKRNMDNFDRITRLVVAILLSSLFFIGGLRDFTGITFLTIALGFFITGITSFCPLYKSTNVLVYKEDKDLLDD
ncbi:hypothetical protein MHTCC0001_14310 [Flavobacteriaceae bacterium MHTCC 0001]